MRKRKKERDLVRKTGEREMRESWGKKESSSVKRRKKFGGK